MNRLFNEYSAAPYEGAVQRLDTIVSDAVIRVWDEIVDKLGACPRDAEALCHSTISCLFAERILRRAMAARKAEQHNHRPPVTEAQESQLTEAKGL